LAPVINRGDQLTFTLLVSNNAKAVLYAKENGKITNSQYQRICHISKATATRDIKDLEARSILVNKGTKGSSAVYELQ